MRSTLFLNLAYLILPVLSKTPSDCLYGISTTVGEFSFNTSNANYYNNTCQNEDFIVSMYVAPRLYCTSKEIIAGQAAIGTTCTHYGGIQLAPYEAVLPKLTDDFITSLPVVNYEDIASALVYNGSILISQALFMTGVDTESIFSEESALHSKYGWGVYRFWGGVLLIGMLTRCVKFFFHKRLDRDHKDQQIEAQGSTNTTKPYTVTQRFNGWIQSKFIIPSALGTTIVDFFGASPSQLAWKHSSYRAFWPNLYYSPSHQIWRYISDRTGIISYANLAVMWMFSGRNNIFLWATGWEFSTFNLFHRHVARIATIQAVVHSVAWTVMESKTKTYKAEWKEQYWYIGATIAMSLILGTSAILIRQKAHKIFLLLHIILSILTIVGVFLRTKSFLGEYDPYLWPLVTIWCFDRFVRIVRQLYCNIHVRTSGSVTTTKSTVQYIEEADLLIVNVTVATKLLRLKPNRHYFLYQPFQWRGWENYPFTLASWSEDTEIANMKSTTTSIANTPASATPTTTKNAHEIAIDPVSSATCQATTAATTLSGPTTLTFYIRPSHTSKSFTSQPRRLTLSVPTRPVPVCILSEGPYGHSIPLHTYENVLLITGGTGTSAALPYLKAHLSSTNITLARNMRFIWTTRQAAMVHHIFQHELSSLPTYQSTDVRVYVTGKKDFVAAVAPHLIPNMDEEKKETGQEMMALGMQYGRPNVRQLIEEMVEEKGNGSLVVLVCGPVGMADEARAAVKRCLDGGARRIEFIEEVYWW